MGPLKVWLAKDVICVAAYGHASDQAWYVMPYHKTMRAHKMMQEIWVFVIGCIV